ncbi:MAG: hypothetical protein ACI9BD_000552, partial [Candidatus Marinamargulisbacteria bacterium]
ENFREEQKIKKRGQDVIVGGYLPIFVFFLQSGPSRRLENRL